MIPASSCRMSSVLTSATLTISLIFAPSIDGDLVPASPYDLLANGSFAKVPYINGGMRDE